MHRNIGLLLRLLNDSRAVVSPLRAIDFVHASEVTVSSGAYAVKNQNRSSDSEWVPAQVHRLSRSPNLFIFWGRWHRHVGVAATNPCNT